MKLEPTKKIYISLLPFLGLSLILILLIIFPLIKGIKKSSQQLLSEKEAQVIFSEEKKNLQDFKVVHQEIKSDLERVDGLFVSSAVPIDSIDFLEKTASDSNVLIEISSVSSKEGDPWPFLDFRIQAFGSFSDFSRFIEKLESSPYLIEVHDSSIKKLAEGDLGSEKLAKFSIGDVAASLSLRIFAK